MGVAAASSNADVDKYVSEYRILNVRQRVLENELLDIHTHIAQVQRKRHSFIVCLRSANSALAQAEKRMQSGAIVRDHMHKELEGAEERMRLLQQEIALIRTQVYVDPWVLKTLLFLMTK